jgi:pimeloyl-ACP methyl ester carboxylesterase
MHNRIIEYQGLTLGFLEAGDSSNPGLVLLHGWPQSKEVYEGVIGELASDHFVLAFDLPAIGDSRGAPRSAEKKELAEVLIGAAERAGARSPVIVGFDVGGMIAYAAARDHARRISAAVVMNTVIPGIEPWSKVLADPRVWHFAFHGIPRLPELLVAGHQREYFDFFVDALSGRKEAISERHRALFARAYERPEALEAGFDWYRAMQADAERNRQPKPIEVPILYARGDVDGGSPDEYVPGLREKGARRVSGCVLGGSGELAPLEAPEAFIREVRAFTLLAKGEPHGAEPLPDAAELIASGRR